MCRMTACSLFSYIVIAWMKIVPMQTIWSGVQFFKISTFSLIFCVSIVFGNISLCYLPVSFNQAIGATTPFFSLQFLLILWHLRERLGSLISPLFTLLLVLSLLLVYVTYLSPLFSFLQFWLQNVVLHCWLELYELWNGTCFQGVDFFMIWSSIFIWFRFVFCCDFRSSHEMLCSTENL